MAIALGLITAIIVIKYKPIYKVSISGQDVGYVQSQQEFAKTIENEINEKEGANVDSVTLNEMPNYELKLVNRNQETNEEEILIALKSNITTTYKYYAVALNNQTQAYVDTIEEAKQIVDTIKAEHEEEIELDLQVIEKYTNNKEEIEVKTTEDVEAQIEEKVNEIIEEDLKTKVPSINGVLLATVPVSGNVTSRFGVVSRIRSGAHTGTDIAAPVGTDIKAVAKGTVVFSGTSGSYGKLVKIDHGNGVETWYAHCSKLLVEEGDTVKSGDIIAQVGLTGNTTGAHLHLEIRLNGVAINPQKYLYN